MSGTEGEDAGDVGRDVCEASLAVFLLQDVPTASPKSASLMLGVLTMSSETSRDRIFSYNLGWMNICALRPRRYE